jgi:hypothetical protein
MHIIWDDIGIHVFVQIMMASQAHCITLTSKLLLNVRSLEEDL